MGHEIDFRVDLLVTRGAIENQYYVREAPAPFRDDIALTFEVQAEITAENDRKLTGDLYLYGGEGGPAPEELGNPNGSWIFYTPDRFHAELYLPSLYLERIWSVFSARPQWFYFNIHEGAEVAELSKHYAGEFRLSYRAGYEVPSSRA
jgi:hypothetical protein